MCEKLPAYWRGLLFTNVVEKEFSDVAPVLVTLHTWYRWSTRRAEESRHFSGRRQPMVRETTESSLDELAKGLASGTVSRGKALRLMGAALVGGALASIPRMAWADDDRCSEGQTRCGERCVNLKTNERHCGSCSNRCASNQRCCKGRCVNLQRNERHCGRCFHRCEEGEECVDGGCVSPPTSPPPP
jgi:hypothetical protein